MFSVSAIEHSLLDLIASLLRHLIIAVVPRRRMMCPLGFMVHLPSEHTFPALQERRTFFVNIDQLDFAFELGQCCLHHRLILQRVETASAVNNSAVLTHHGQALNQNFQLKRVQRMTEHRMESFPKTNVLAESAVAGARDVAKNAIEFEIPHVFSLF